jgi:uncharacterized membrane protein
MSPRAIKMLLAASLALNIFILGAAAGAGYMWWQARERPQAEAQRGLRFAAAELSPEQRRAFRQALAEARRRAADDTATARTSREAAARLLAAEPLNAAAVETELARVRAADMALRSRLEQAIVGYAATLSPADRERLVDGLRGRGAMLQQGPAPKN